jgi:hypothetical protein
MARCKEYNCDHHQGSGRNKKNQGDGVDAKGRLGLGHPQTLTAAVAAPQFA